MKTINANDRVRYSAPMFRTVELSTERGFETSDLSEEKPEGGDWYYYV